MSNIIFNKTLFEIMSYFAKDIDASYYGRELSRKTQLNQKTVQSALNLLEKEKLLIAKTKGKLKEFVLNKSNITLKGILISTEVYKFYKLGLSNFEIYAIINDILSITDATLAIFGSFAKGTATKSSDFDILVIGRISKEKIKDIRDRYSRKIHLVILDEKMFLKGLKNKEKFIEEVIDNHIICQGFEKFTYWRFLNG